MRLRTRVCYGRLAPAGQTRGKQTLGFNTAQACSGFDATAPSQGPSVQGRGCEELLGQTRLPLGAELQLQLQRHQALAPLMWYLRVEVNCAGGILRERAHKQ